MGTYSSYIAGLNHPRTRKAANKLRSGLELQTKREPDNPHDSNAIALQDQEGAMVGYIPAKHAQWLAARLDKERSTRVVVTKVRRKGFLWWQPIFADTEIRTGGEAEQ